MSGRGARSALRVAAATIGLLVALCIPMSVALLIALNLDDDAGGVHWLAIVGASMLGIVPVIAGTIVATWNTDPRTPRGRTHFLRLVAGAFAVVVASAAAVVTSALVGALPLWAAVLATVGSVLFTWLSIWFGEAIRRRNAQAALTEWTPDELAPAVVRRTWRRIALSFIITLLVSIVGVILIDGSAGESNLVAMIALAVSLAAMVSSGVCVAIYLPLVRRVPPLFAGDLDRQKKITAVVWKGQNTALDPAETELAVRYAGIAVGFLPFQAAQNVLLFLGLGALRVVNLASGNTELLVFDLIFLVVIVIVLVVTVPFWVIRLRRVRRYLEDRSAPVR